MSKLEEIGLYYNVFEAQLDKSILDEYGIKSIIQNAETVTMDWALGNAIGGIRLLVNEDNVEEAQNILIEHRESVAEDLLLDSDSENDAYWMTEDAEDIDPEDEEESEQKVTPEETEETQLSPEVWKIFKSAVIGLGIFPIHIYTLFLMLNYLQSDEEPHSHDSIYLFFSTAFVIVNMAFINFLFQIF